MFESHFHGLLQTILHIFCTRANPKLHARTSATTNIPMTLTNISAIADKTINGLVFNRNGWEFDDRSQTDHNNYPTAPPVLNRMFKAQRTSMKINQTITQLTASRIKQNSNLSKYTCTQFITNHISTTRNHTTPQARSLTMKQNSHNQVTNCNHDKLLQSRLAPLTFNSITH